MSTKVLTLSSVLLVCGSVIACTAPRTKVHEVQITDPVAPQVRPQVHKVTQYCNEQGHPVSYSLAFETPVCIDGVCRPVRASMFWDALGNFEKLQVPTDWPLTKKEHKPFSEADYLKLQHVLKMKQSILGKYTPDALAKQDPNTAWMWRTEKETTPLSNVDGVTAATPLTIQKSVVEDAAYTTWTLWWWANGDIVPILRRLTLRHMDEGYLKFLLISGKQVYVSFALKYLKENCVENEAFVDAVLNLMRNTVRENFTLALAYLTEAVEDHSQLHQRLIKASVQMRVSHSPLILDYLDNQEKLSADTLEMLAGALDRFGYYQVHLILRLLEKHQWFTKKTESHIAGLLSSEDFFIARRAYTYLQQHDISARTRAELDAFEKQHGERL